MDAIEKLQAANALTKQVNDLKRQIEIIQKVIATALENTGEYPVLAMRLHPYKSDTMPLLPSYIPVERKAFYDNYVKNMQDDKTGLESQIVGLLN